MSVISFGEVRQADVVSNGASAHSRLAAILTQNERNLFSAHWVEEYGVCAVPMGEDGSGIDLSALFEINPEILVACWSTPRLPQAWLDSPQCALRYLCYLGGSVRRVIPPSFIEKGGLVTNWGGLIAPQVAEHALLLALSILRRQDEWNAFIHLPPPARRGRPIATRTLFGRKVGLHGFGWVARSMIPLLRPFQVELRAYSEGVAPEFIEKHGAIPCDSLTGLFSSSDLIFECEALTPHTLGLVSSEVLAALPDHSVFVNIGRGPVVDESALVAEVRSGRIRAAIDVSVSEPFTPDLELFTLDGFIVSPHIAGPTRDRLPTCGEFARQNIERYLKGEPLQALVTPEVYDRST